MNNTAICGGHDVIVPARRGLILPLEWQFRAGILIHYLTSEVIDIKESENSITFTLRQKEAHASVSLEGYHLDESHTSDKDIHITDGLLTFFKN